MSNLLYHYCPTQSFHSIIKNESVWLTSLSLSNDAMEGHLARKLFLTMIQGNEHTSVERTQLEKVIKIFEEKIDGLGFCLSSKYDQLSQWRGYGDDGKGFCIGFDREDLEKNINSLRRSHDNDVFLMEVLYKHEDHQSLIFDVLKFLKENLLRDNIGMVNKQHKPATVNEIVLKLARALYQIKSQAFEEESEFRLFTFYENSDNDIQFKPSGNLLTPYWELMLERVDKKSVGKVVLGPKNITPINLVEKFLSNHGFHNVEVVKSKATYR
jgi:hypothetical protein